jgi:ribulose-phosphate 3-epimerase
MKIVPSVLAEKFDDFVKRVRQAESFTDYVQVDLMDGVFVETKSFPPQKITSVQTPLSFEVHLMAEDPLAFLNGMEHPGLKKVIFHCEIGADHLALARTIRERGLSPGVAIKPGTDLAQCRGVAEHVDTLLFLTVDPCCYGSTFKPEVLQKIAGARKLFPAKVISVDGGVSLDNLKDLFDAGVDYACVGSRIFLQNDPRESYRLFARRVQELENR